MRLVLLTKAQFDAWRTFADPAWQPFKAAWLERGFCHPPEGDPRDDPRTSLRSRLWEIAQARPDDLGRWVREARGSTQREVVGHVFAMWRELREEVPLESDLDDAKLATRYDENARMRARLTSIRDIVEVGR